MKRLNRIIALMILFLISLSFFLINDKENDFQEALHPKLYNEYEDKDENPDKDAEWTAEQARRHQEILQRMREITEQFGNKKNNKTTIDYANGALTGTWTNRGPKNMPGAFKFAEMLDGTDIMYAVSHNHYPSEYGSKAFIFKGTVYNPTTGTGGDDFEVITANWPNRYKNLFAFHYNGGVRLVAHIENGPLYYSDDEGGNWILSTGLPAANMSSVINRQDDHAIYVTDGKDVFKSVDKGENFTLFDSFPSNVNSALYSPRYSNQPDSDKVYLARSGSFYTVTSTGSAFVLNGTYSTSHGNDRFSLGGDSRKLYVVENKKYWVSVDSGSTWTEKFPHGNQYGDTSGAMPSGLFLAVNPDNENIVTSGYTNPVVSLTGLDDVVSSHTGWGWYQGGNNLLQNDYYNRIRFNYHPDFQSCHFFYNASGNLFSAKCTDGGVFVSYKEWTDFPVSGTGFDNSDYANAHFININTLNTINPLIYRKTVFTGYMDPNHLFYSTQDQGTQMTMSGSTGVLLDVYQNIGGDGPTMDSYDGMNVWKWDRRGDNVSAPVAMYDANGNLRTAMQIKNMANSNPIIDFNRDTSVGWVQNYIDHDDPDGNLWLLANKLDRATWDGNTMTGHTIDKGINQVAALAQGWANPDKLYMLQDGKVFISSDRGDVFGAGITTPFSMTGDKKNIGSGVVLPTNDQWILFCGPSNNQVGAILSKDGGSTWVNVTGIFPSGEFAQTGGMVATPDGKFVFAGTDIGPYVFDVNTETWYSIAEGAGFFNATDVEYIPSINTVRFGSWGSGVLDFKIENTLDSFESVVVNNEFVLYPNPIVDYLYIQSNFKTSERMDLSIFSLSNKLVYREELLYKDTPLRIDLSNLSSGVYTLHLKSNDYKTKVFKVIKK